MFFHVFSCEVVGVEWVGEGVISETSGELLMMQLYQLINITEFPLQSCYYIHSGFSQFIVWGTALDGLY